MKLGWLNNDLIHHEIAHSSSERFGDFEVVLTLLNEDIVQTWHISKALLFLILKKLVESTFLHKRHIFEFHLDWFEIKVSVVYLKGQERNIYQLNFCRRFKWNRSLMAFNRTAFWCIQSSKTWFLQFLVSNCEELRKKSFMPKSDIIQIKA